MNKKKWRLWTGIFLSIVMTMSLLAGCGGSGSKDGKTGKDTSFSWWIYKADGNGEYYEEYDESPVVQYVNAQYWDSEKGGIAEEGKGTKLNLSFIVPITGSEIDNYNTMLATGEYPEIIDLMVAKESPQAMHDTGILMDITEYVEKYMPNYLAFLDANPELKPFAQVKEEDGSTHYYSICAFTDGIQEPWQGMCYRRDWVVKYAEPTEYVWDWESDYVKENGHPEVTPLEKAQKEGKLNGWKKNEVKTFTADYGENPSEDYTDNVIFPSGKTDPLTISDWEWMFAAFDKAITERGWKDDSSAYCTSIAYQGSFGSGDLVSSFGGGTGNFYIKDGKVSFDGASENFKTYLECMNTWYEKGWLDTEFNTRAQDAFYKINESAVNRGMVGLWDGANTTIGTAIRTTCQDASDAADAYAMGCALPINDVYGTADQMYKAPDALYQGGRKAGSIGITKKAEGKDLATLFTYFDWTYTDLGSKTLRLGLNEEQLASVELDPDLYAKYNLTTAYTISEGEDGIPVYKKAVDASDRLSIAVNGGRMGIGLEVTGTDEYHLDTGIPTVNKNAINQWSTYLNTGSVDSYITLLNIEESDAYNKLYTQLLDYQSRVVPGLIKDGLGEWDSYVKGLEDLDTETVRGYLQNHVN